MEKNKKQTKKSPYQKLHLEHVFSYLQTNEYPSDDRYTNRIHRSNLRQRALDFIIENGKLYLQYYSAPLALACDNNSDTDRQKSEKKILNRLVLFSNEDKLQAFYECHISKEGQHHGKNRTVALCRDKYYFLCMIEMVKMLIRNCPICSSRLDTTNIVAKEHENDMDILDMLYGEKHGNHVLQERENLCSHGNSDCIIECFKTSTFIDVDHIENINVIGQSLELSDICHNEIKTVHETNQDSTTKQNSADEKSCMLKNEEKEKKEECENTDKYVVEMYNLESDVEPDYFWHSVELSVLGPYEFQGRQKYLMIFLELYSLWPEVTIVDTISPAIITMGLLDLLCRYNVMKRLYLRKSACGALQLFTPDVQLLQTANLHIDIVKMDVPYSEEIWTLLKTQVSSFIKNNSDWPCTLSFSIMPFRIKYDDGVDGTCTLFTRRRHRKKTKDKIPNFDSNQQKLLNLYRYCSSKSVKLGDKNDKNTTDITTEVEGYSVSEYPVKQDVNLTENNPLKYLRDNPEATQMVNDNEIVKSPCKMTTRNKRIDYCSLSSDKQTTDSLKTKKRNVSSSGSVSESSKKIKLVSGKRKSNHENMKSNNCKIVENQKETFDDSLVLEQKFCKDEDQATCNKKSPSEIKDTMTEHSDNSEIGKKCLTYNVQSKICLSKKKVKSDMVKQLEHEKEHDGNPRTVEEIEDHTLTRHSKQQIKGGKDGKIFTGSKESVTERHRTNSQGSGKDCKSKKLMKAHRRSLTCLCSTCGKTVKSFSLKSHLQMHSDPKRLECPHCFKGFFTDTHLTAHINNRHIFSSPSLFKCTVCSQVFTRKGSLKRHEQSRHQNLKLYQCDKCGKLFHRKHYLTSHHKICQQTLNKKIPRTSSENGIRKDKLKQGSKESASGDKTLITNHRIGQKEVASGDKTLITNHRIGHLQSLNQKTNAVTKHIKDTKHVTEDIKDTKHVTEHIKDTKHVTEHIKDTKPMSGQKIDLDNKPYCPEHDITCIVNMNKSNVQEITHCVMYETESGTEYHIISDDPNKPIDNDTIAALEMLASLKEKGQ
ncbi:uncharacterized protein LOC127708477 [Mytilus californianus]|uniref:uncharacterized protein LOC127708477 n=1 Tax=Mytilus californianus TaxID=6549 RepID=UPI002247326A|nr:uncharacterized protein LOC127708477 [Mytilus californianus]